MQLEDMKGVFHRNCRLNEIQKPEKYMVIVEEIHIGPL